MNQFKFFKGQANGPLFWRTAMGEYKLVSEMTSEHMFNICLTLTLDRGTIPDPYLGKTNQEWKEIFEDELRNRINRANERV